MRVRVVTRAMRGLLSVSDLLKPWKFAWPAFQLWSHKIMRWMVPLFLIALFIANWLAARFFVLSIHAGGAIVLLCCGAAEHASAAASPMEALGIPLFFCTLNAAALVSMLEICRGRKYVTWQTVRARR